MPLLSEDQGQEIRFGSAIYQSETGQTDTTHFNQELLLLLSGTGNVPSDIIKQIASTALFAYRILVHKHFYLLAPKRLLLHTFIKSSRFLVRLQKIHPHYLMHMAAISVSENMWWMEFAGDFRGYFFHENEMVSVKSIHAHGRDAPAYFGRGKELPIMQTLGDKFITGDKLLIITTDLVKTVNEKKIQEIMWSDKSSQTKAEMLISLAQQRRKQANYGVILVEKVPRKEKSALLIEYRTRRRITN